MKLRMAVAAAAVACGVATTVAIATPAHAAPYLCTVKAGADWYRAWDCEGDGWFGAWVRCKAASGYEWERYGPPKKAETSDWSYAYCDGGQVISTSSVTY